MSAAKPAAGKVTPLRQAGVRPVDGATPSLMLDDEVYFQHPEAGPVSGRVFAIGRDGFQVEHPELGECQVKWDCLLGHKVRQQRHIALVESGEDGHVGVDQHGNRIFIRGPLNPDDPEADLAPGGRLAKSLRYDPELIRLAQAAFGAKAETTTDLVPLAGALGEFAKAWQTHLERQAVREEEADVRREALDVELLKAQAAVAATFAGALGDVLKAHTAEFTRLHGDLASLQGLVAGLTLQKDAAGG